MLIFITFSRICVAGNFCPGERSLPASRTLEQNGPAEASLFSGEVNGGTSNDSSQSNDYGEDNVLSWQTTFTQAISAPHDSQEPPKGHEERINAIENDDLSVDTLDDNHTFHRRNSELDNEIPPPIYSVQGELFAHNDQHIYDHQKFVGYLEQSYDHSADEIEQKIKLSSSVQIEGVEQSCDQMLTKRDRIESLKGKIIQFEQKIPILILVLFKINFVFLILLPIINFICSLSTSNRSLFKFLNMGNIVWAMVLILLILLAYYFRLIRDSNFHSFSFTIFVVALMQVLILFVDYFRLSIA